MHLHDSICRYWLVEKIWSWMFFCTLLDRNYDKLLVQNLHIVEPHLTDNPEKQPSTIFRTLNLVPNACLFTIKTPWNVEPPTFHKVDRLHSSTIQTFILPLSLIVLTLLNFVRQQKGPKMRHCCAHQPEYTLPHPLEVYWKPLKYIYLHITDTQWWSQQCPL